MFNLPPSLTRHFRDAAGQFDYRVLLGAPDATLVALACGMRADERIELYRRLAGLRVSWLERMMAQAAGVDLDAQRRRFQRILEEAHSLQAPVPAVNLVPQFASESAS